MIIICFTGRCMGENGEGVREGRYWGGRSQRSIKEEQAAADLLAPTRVFVALYTVLYKGGGREEEEKEEEIEEKEEEEKEGRQER
ncbi:hypothetical protein E2C01_099502 [Portunus trituberculatus]|uniref:Uncharacterized protein n=1 Tax=Portunus trituberculatus TaxID=210409 RepID=A0A5B7KB52_PORTR|nr:hypothetical protein [Portunus trituberculatus]